MLNICGKTVLRVTSVTDVHYSASFLSIKKHLLISLLNIYLITRLTLLLCQQITRAWCNFKRNFNLYHITDTHPLTKINMKNIRILEFHVSRNKYL